MVKINIDDIPNWVTQAARSLEIYFKKNGIEEWEFMGVCSREIAFKQRNRISELESEIIKLNMEVDDLNDRICDYSIM